MRGLLKYVGCESCSFKALHWCTQSTYEAWGDSSALHVDEVEKNQQSFSDNMAIYIASHRRTCSQLNSVFPIDNWWCTSLDYWRCYSRYETTSEDHVIILLVYDDCEVKVTLHYARCNRTWHLTWYSSKWLWDSHALICKLNKFQWMAFNCIIDTKFSPFRWPKCRDCSRLQSCWCWQWTGEDLATRATDDVL